MSTSNADRPLGEQPTAAWQTPGYPATGSPLAGQPGWQGGYVQPIADGSTGYPGRPAMPPGQLYPGYPAPPGQPYAPGYVLPGYAAPGLPAAPSRPGSVTAAAVLAFIQGGINLIAGFSTLAGSTEINDRPVYTGEIPSVFLIMSLAAIVSGGLLIAGGVAAFNKNAVLLNVGVGLSIGVSIWWMTYFGFGGVIVSMATLMAVLPIISGALVNQAAVRSWMAQK